MTNQPENETQELSRNQIVAWWGSIIGVCAVIAFGSIFVTRAYMERRNYEVENYRPPHVAKLETDLNVTNRDGSEVALSQLRDKVYVAGYQYTECPAGCLGMASIMKLLEEEFGDDPQFRLVSISVNPEGDTPEKMDAWVKQNGVDSPDWWFLTGDPEEIANYMISEFRFYATEKVTDPAMIPAIGEYSHDQRLALVDGGANVRGYYDVMNVERGDLELQRLRMDLKLVLDPDLKLSDIQEEFSVEAPE